MRNTTIALLALFLLIPLISGCGSKNEIDTSAPPQQNEETSGESLEERVEKLAGGDPSAGERREGQVIVWLQNGITEEEAYQIFLSHGFERQNVEKRYTPQMYVLHFSEAERDIKSVIRELLLDSNILNASASAIAQPAD